MDKYLDETGLSHFWGKIKSFVNGLNFASSTSPGGAANKAIGIPSGQLDSTSTSTVFTATIDGITELVDGVCCYLKNGVVDSASGYTININNLGAKPVYNTLSGGQTVSIFTEQSTFLLVYNSTRVAGGCWDAYMGYYENDTAMKMRTDHKSLPMSNNVYRYRILFTSADGSKYVPSNASSSTSSSAKKTVCSTPINPFGEIVYYSAVTSATAGSRPAVTTLWNQTVVVIGYSFNRTGTTPSMTTWKPVYVKATPQSDGSAIIDADTPIVQDLPTTDDGYIYIFLGIAYSSVSIELMPNHPVYYFKNGAIRIWTGVAQLDAGSGSFNNKPSSPSVGTRYFCTDKKTTEGNTNGIVIYYNGNNWVDALGRTVT